MKGKSHSKVLTRRGMVDRVGCTNLRNKSAGSLSVKCKSLLLNHLNFKNSGVPSRIMFFDHGSWTDFPAEAAIALVNGFQDGKPTVEIRIDGSMYLVDFLRMLQIDLGSGCRRSIAWIDVNQKCFFPKYFVGEQADEQEGDNSCLKLEIEIKIDRSEGSMVGHGGDSSGVDRISVASKTGEQDCQPMMNQGVCGGRVPGRENYQRNSGLVSQKKADEVKKNHGHTEMGSHGRAQEFFLPNSGSAEFCSPVEFSCKDLACRNDKFCTRSPILVKQLGLENCSSLGENAAADMTGMGEKLFARKRTLVDRNLECLGDEPADDSHSSKKVCLEKGPPGIDAAVATTKLGMISNTAGEDKPSSEIQRCSLVINKGTGKVKDADLPCKEAAAIDNCVNNICLHSHHEGRVVNSDMKLLLEIVDSKSGKEPVLSVFNPSPVQDLSSGDCLTQLLPRFSSLGGRLTKLKDDSKTYITIKNLFLRGLGRISPLVMVTAIYWCSRTSPLSNNRFLSFQRHIEAMKISRGSANLRYGWHGTSGQGVESIILHGFGQPKASHGPESYGVGIYLSPEGQSHLSVSYAEPDENGEQHVVLCRIILGNMEQVQPGSDQFHPSDENFDSGVDDLNNPRRYIVWSTHMNAHILPEYVLSFSLPNHLKGKWKERSHGVSANNNCPTEIANSASNFPVQTIGSARTLQVSMDVSGEICKKDHCPIRAPHMSFSKLFSFLEKHLPQPSILILDNLYDQFKGGKIARELFIREIRSVIGDKLLIDAIHCIRNEV